MQNHSEIMGKNTSRPKTCKLYHKVQIHVQDIHPNPLEIYLINVKLPTTSPHMSPSPTAPHTTPRIWGKVVGDSVRISEYFHRIWVDFLHVDVLFFFKMLTPFGSRYNFVGVIYE